MPQLSMREPKLNRQYRTSSGVYSTDTQIWSHYASRIQDAQRDRELIAEGEHRKQTDMQRHRVAAHPPCGRRALNHINNRNSNVVHSKRNVIPSYMNQRELQLSAAFANEVQLREHNTPMNVPAVLACKNLHDVFCQRRPAVAASIIARRLLADLHNMFQVKQAYENAAELRRPEERKAKAEAKQELGQARGKQRKTHRRYPRAVGFSAKGLPGPFYLAAAVATLSCRVS